MNNSTTKHLRDPTCGPMFTGSALIGLFVLGGCGDWSRDVTTYRTVLDGPHPPSLAPFATRDDVSLVYALRLANADNDAIASRGEDYIQALAEKMRQAGTFLPTISVAPSFSYSHYNNSNVDGIASNTTTTGVSLTAPSTNSHQLTVPLNASLTGSVSSLSNLDALDSITLQRAQLLLDERETILLEVVQSYYSALKSEQQTHVYEKGLLLKAEKVRDQEARLRLGSVRPLDLAQSQADLAGTQASLIQSRTDMLNSRSALARLIGVTAIQGALTDAFEAPAQMAPLEVWQMDAATHRQDLLAADRATESSQSSLAAAIQEYFPSVAINFSYFLYNSPSSTLAWNSIFSVNIPIFSALSIEADVRKAWSIYRQNELAQIRIRRQVIDDINQNYNNVLSSRGRIIELQIEVVAAQRAFDLSERAYALGSVSNLDRLTQQDNLLSAQLSLISEQFNYKVNYLGLLRSAGQLAQAYVMVH